MGITYETPEQKEALIQDIKSQLASKHGIESTEDNVLLDELAKTEFTRRETQASYTKGQQVLKGLEAEKNFLHSQLVTNLDLSIKQDEELQELKLDDPDKYIETVEKLKTQKKSEFDKTISEGLSHANSEASKNFAQMSREEKLKSFSEENSDINLMEQAIRDQLPPFLVNQFLNEEISSDDFSKKAKHFITGNVKSSKAKEMQDDLKDNFKDLAGKQKLDSKDVKKDIVASYKNMTF